MCFIIHSTNLPHGALDTSPAVGRDHRVLELTALRAEHLPPLRGRLYPVSSLAPAEEVVHDG